VLISITDEGRRVQRRAVRELDPEVVRWFACLDKAHKLSLLSVLGKLGTHLRATHRATHGPG